MKKIGIYIHIPFCRQKCKYCAFVSFCDLEKIDKYIDCLCKEIIGFRASEDCCVDTIYIGGGTPSLLKQKHIEKIFDEVIFIKDGSIILHQNSEDLRLERQASINDIFKEEFRC